MELNEKLEKRLLYLQLLLLFILFLVLNLISEGSYGGADDLGHFRFAKYAIKYPSLILDQWAKPLFTLLAAPFAQLGYWGVRLFNVIIGTITAFVVFKIARHLHVKNSWCLPVILFFIPVYTSMLLSGMTEILFGLVLAVSIFLLLKKKFIWSAVVISFLHMARTEGFVIWPLFIAAFIWKRQWRAIPFLTTGSLVYTLAGGFYFKDFLCLFTKMPYSGTYDIYGHGELLHFVKATKLIFGIPLTLFFIIGCFHTFWIFIKSKNKELLFEVLVILMPIGVFYAAHSYVWWKGINSLGMIRVMACISPLFSIYSLKGANITLQSIQSVNLPKLNHYSKMGWLTKAFFIVLTYYLIISTPFKVMKIPVPLPPKEQQVKKAAEWFMNSAYKNRKIYLWEPYFWFFAGIESYNTPKMIDGIPNKMHPEMGVLPGEIVIWDAHFSAVDGRFPFENIVSNPYFRLVNAVVPKREILVFGHPYFIAFFERLDLPGSHNNLAIMDSFRTAATPKYCPQFLNISSASQISPSKDNIGAVKNYGFEITSRQEFYDLIKTKAAQIGINDGSILKINLNIHKGPVILVVSLKHNHNIYFYQPREIKSQLEWQAQELKIPLVLPKKDNDIFSVYIWNKDKSWAEIDKINIEILRECD